MRQLAEPEQRLYSLDAFRGLTIAGMILVNNPGSWSHVYAPLRHAEWNGCTPTDLVFPFFLFIVGVAMTYSFAKLLETGTKGDAYRRVARRVALIFAIGLFLALFPDFDFASLRIAGVLQRIAVVYGIASLVVLNLGVSGQAVTALTLLIGYWLAMTWIPVPGHGAGVLTPEGNLAGYIDSLFLPGRKYRGTWDPEGILSTFPAVATTLLGVLTGHLLRSSTNRKKAAVVLFLTGVALLAGGLVWDNWFPINKHIWTSSYVLYTAGAAQVLLSICFLLCDVLRWRRLFFPAVVLGVNPITIYALAGIGSDLLSTWKIADEGQDISAKSWLMNHLFLPYASPINASLAFALCYVLFWFLIALVLYRLRIFIRV